MMMLELFTIEEANLMCIFDTSSRSSLIGELESALPHFDDAGLNEIAVSVLKKLYALTDDDFAALDFYPEYDDEEPDEQGRGVLKSADASTALFSRVSTAPFAVEIPIEEV